MPESSTPPLRKDPDMLENQAPLPIPNRPLLLRIFLSPGEHRLRAGWRILAQLLIFFMLLNAVALGVGIFFTYQGQADAQNALLWGQIISVIAVTLSVYIARGYLDQRPFASLGIHLNRQAVRDILAGFLISAVMIAFLFLLMLAFGWLEGVSLNLDQSGGQSPLSLIVFLFIFFALTGWQEELLVRGYWMQNLAEGLNKPLAVLLTSLIFAFLHAWNPESAWNSYLGIFLAGLFFAWAYYKTGNLWLPIALHSGWNFFLGPIFGFPVSGIDTFRLVTHTVRGPSWLTGAAFGPEAGLILIPALLVTVLLVSFYTRAYPSAPTAANQVNP